MIRRNSFRSGSVASSQKVTIRLLDDNEVIQVDFQAHHKGQFLLDYVCRQLNIAEKDYFGLRYIDSTKQRLWLDLGKSVTKQLKEMTPFIICFRFKFYPGDPMLLKEEVTRYQLVLQLRRDLLHGRLHSPNQSDIATLSSYIVQSELGDYDPDVHTGNYVSEYELVARQSAELEEKVKDLHSNLQGVTPAESDLLFLKKAAALDTYGVEPYPVKDQQGEQLFLGINHSGIATFQGSKRLTHFKWSQITKLNYEAKMFIIHISLSEDSRNRKKETTGFKCQSSKACKCLWRHGVEQRLFFTCPSAQEITSVRGGGLFGSRFRYSGKVQKEILEDPGPLRAVDGVIQRTPLYRSLQRNKPSSLSHSPMQLGYGSLPRSNHSAPNDTRMDAGFGELGSSSSLPLSTLSTPFGPDQGLPMLETLEEDSSPVTETDLKTDTSVIAVDEMKQSSAPVAFAAILEKPKRSSLLITPQTALGLLKGNHQEMSSEGVGDNDHNTADGFLTCAFGASGNEEIAPSETRPTEDIADVETAWTKFSSAAREKRRKFGTMAAPRIEAIVQGGGASWAKARKHIKRLRKKDVVPGDSELLIPAGVSFGKSESNDSVRLSSTNIEPETVASASLSQTEGEQVVEYVSSPVPESAVQQETQTESPLFPNVEESFDFGFERVGGEGGGDGDTENTLRESKITKIETPTSSPIPSSGPLVSAEIGIIPGKASSGQQGQMRLSMWKIFVVCMICVLIALLFVAILAIEVDIDIFQKMRRIPEVELFQTEVYEPVKYFIRDKIHNISDNINLTFQ